MNVMNSWVLASVSEPCLIGGTVDQLLAPDGRSAVSSEVFYLDKKQGLAKTFERGYLLAPANRH